MSLESSVKGAGAEAPAGEVTGLPGTLSLCQQSQQGPALGTWPPGAGEGRGTPPAHNLESPVRGAAFTDPHLRWGDGDGVWREAVPSEPALSEELRTQPPTPARTEPSCRLAWVPCSRSGRSSLLGI